MRLNKIREYDRIISKHRRYLYGRQVIWNDELAGYRGNRIL